MRAGSGGGGTGGAYSSGDMTPQQQKVVQQFVQQKVRQGNSAIKNFVKKPNKFQSQEEFYCEVCKIACGSQFVSQLKPCLYNTDNLLLLFFFLSINILGI